MRYVTLALLLPLALLPPLVAPADAEERTAVSDAARATATANNRFALDLHAELRAMRGNLFYSPYSITSALAMARVGARGRTAEQMDAVLHTQTSGPTGHRDLRLALTPSRVRQWDGKQDKEVPSFELSVANAIWGQQGVTFHGPFLTALDQAFGAPLERLDFRQPGKARDVINEWVEKHTREKIKDIVPEGLPTPDTVMTLANAIYFKAAWADPFSERATKKAPFHRDEGDAVEVELMRRAGGYRYAEDADVQVLELPYRGRDTSMLVILPKARGGLSAVEAKLDDARVAGWLGALERKQVTVLLPKFELTYDLDVAATLGAMGMTDAFSAAKADFSGMADVNPLFVGAVLHKAFVALDEHGTEAAAATVLAMRGAGRPREPEIEFVADHPFLFAIRHEPSGAILFLGRLSDPPQA
jgi:serpin B